MKPTEILKSEHRVIEQVLDCLEKITTNCSKSGELNVGESERAIDFLCVFADRCHHAKEEQCLFPMMERNGYSSQSGPTAVMRSEHDLGRECIKGMRNAIKMAFTGDMTGQRSFNGFARQYIELLRQHIQKEDHCLFAMADQTLSDADQAKLQEQFESIERVHPGEHERYLMLANDLADSLGVSRKIELSTCTTCCGKH